MNRFLLAILPLLLLIACSPANDNAVQTAAAELVATAAVQTSTAEAQADATRRAERDSAVATAVVETAAAVAVQTAVVATQEAAFTPTPLPQLTCAEEASAFLGSLSSILGRWQDAIDVANSTARVSLAGPVGELQAIRREVDEQDVPSCATPAKIALVSSMDHLIEAFLLFMQESADSRINQEFDESATAMDYFSTLVQGISAEATRETSEATRQARVTPTPTD